MRSRRAFLSTLAAGSVGALGGCTGRTGDSGAPSTAAPTDTTADPTTTASPSVESASLLLNWKPNALHLPYYTAADRGYYEDEGLPPLEITAGQGSSFSAKQVGLGNVAFGVTSSDQVLTINSQGTPVDCVGVMMQRSPVVVFTTADVFGEPLTEISQLRGTTVGTGPGMVKVLTKLLLERQGVLEDVTITSTGYNTVQELLSGNVDAAGGVFGDVVDAAHQGAETSSIPVATHVPSYGHVLATNPAFAEDHGAAVRAFLRATAKGTVRAANNPGEAMAAFMAANPELDTSRELERDKWDRMVDGYLRSEAVAEQGWGVSTEAPWTTMYEALDGAGMLEAEIDPTSVYTNAYLDTSAEYIRDFQSTVSE